MTCPRCRADVEPLPVSYTWWGGFLGPKLLSHVECPQCRGRFNGKTGQDNTSAIVLYSMIVGLAVAAVCVYVLWRL